MANWGCASKKTSGKAHKHGAIALGGGQKATCRQSSRPSHQHWIQGKKDIDCVNKHNETFDKAQETKNVEGKDRAVPMFKTISTLKTTKSPARVPHQHGRSCQTKTHCTRCASFMLDLSPQGRGRWKSRRDWPDKSADVRHCGNAIEAFILELESNDSTPFGFWLYEWLRSSRLYFT